MRNILNAAFVPVLAALAFGCTSTTALRTSEPDDLYYASSDKTMRQEVSVASTQSAYTHPGEASEVAENPEYYDPEAAKQPTIINNYYDYDSYYSSRGRRSYVYFNDPFYSPFGYSAAYCYGIYDPFCFPGYYPYSGLAVSISYGFGNPYGYGYGYRPYGAYGYGYRPYDYYGYGYGGGYGSYYHGFYDGYYAGNNYGYGYGYNRKKIQYGPRGDRSVVPATSTTGGGRGNNPGRSAVEPGNGGRINVDPGRVGRTTAPSQSAGQPARVNTGTSQPAPATPGRPARVNSAKPATQPGRVGGVKNAPARETVQPENYQFQNNQVPAQEEARPSRTRDAAVPGQVQPERPSYQQERPTYQEPVQQQRPAREYSRPERPVQRETRQAPSYNNDRPSYHDNSPSRSSGGSAPSRSGGRPRN